MSVHESGVSAPGEADPAGRRRPQVASERVGTAAPTGRPVARRRPLRERVAAVSFALCLVDVVCLLGLLAAAEAPLLAAGFAVLLVTARWSMRLYRPRVRLSWLDDVPQSLSALAIATAVCLAVLAVADQDDAARLRFVRLLLAFVLVNEALRVACLAAVRLARRRLGLGDITLILGAGHIGRALATTMLDRPELGLRPVGFIDTDPRTGTDSEVPVLARSGRELAVVIDRYRVGTVVVSFALTQESQLVDTVITAHQMGCTVLVVPRMYELHHDGPDVERLRGYPLIRLSPDPTARPAWWVKRTLDVLLATLALVAFAPVFAVAALAVLIESGRPVLFHQTRVGLDSKAFRIHKLRSLRPASVDESDNVWSIATDQRVGAVGRFLRRTSLDELPQLWNIMMGDMSFVGPRPERPGFVERFSLEHERYWARHRVPAGLTGLAQVNGLRGDTSIADRARFDNYYIANWSLWADFRIVVLTVREVLRGGGA